MNSGQYCFSLQPKIIIERIIKTIIQKDYWRIIEGLSGDFLLGHSPGGNSFALIKSERLC